MIFIDTGIFLANFLSTDQFHLVVKPNLESIFNEDLITTSDVIAETMNWLTRKTNSRLIQEIGTTLIEEEITKIINVNYEDRLEALSILKKYSDQKLSFTDATSFAVIKKLKIKRIFSLDKHFKLIKGAENILELP